MKPLGGQIPAPMLVLLAGLTVQLSSALAKSVFVVAGPLGTVFLRVSLSAVLLLLLWRPKWQGPIRQHWSLIAAYGSGLAVMNTCFYLAIDRIPLGVAVAIEFTGPLGLAVIKSRRWLDLLWVGLAGSGIMLLSPLQGSSLDPVGLGFAMAAALAWAAYILLTEATGRRIPGIEGLIWAMVFGATLLAPIGIGAAGSSLINGRLIAIAAGVALLSSATYALELLALRRLPVSAFGVLLSTEPMLAAAAGFLLLGEILTLRSIAAVVLISIAAAGAARYGTAPAAETL